MRAVREPKEGKTRRGEGLLAQLPTAVLGGAIISLAVLLAVVGPVFTQRRLAVRYERRADIHEAFLGLRCTLVCFNHLRRRF